MEEFEIWMPVVGYEGRYEVSHFGRVKSVQGMNAGKMLSQNESGKRLIVGLRNGVKKKAKFVHHLVLFAFHSVKQDGAVCCHGDGNFRNNYIGNLRWGTYHDNMQDALKHGTRFFNTGEKHGQSKLNDTDIPIIRRLISDGVIKRVIAARYNVGRTTIINISKNRTWKHVPLSYTDENI